MFVILLRFVPVLYIDYCRLMEQKKLISVIIPVYNGEKYMAQCIENMLYQTYKNLEIIVIDDGSTDNSATVAERYPVKLIRQENQGVSVARNAGMDSATGDYLHFMDVDDCVNLDFYEKMLETALATDADMVYCGLVHERLPSLTVLFDEKVLAIDPDDKMMLTNVGSQGGCYKYLFRSDFLKRNGLKFEKELRNAQDLVFSIQAVYLANKIVSVPHAVYYYRNRAGSAMTSRGSKRRKRHAYRRKAKDFCIEFSRQHGLQVIAAPACKVRYRILGIPALKKIVYNTGKTRWYLFGICVMQQK